MTTYEYAADLCDHHDLRVCSECGHNDEQRMIPWTKIHGGRRSDEDDAGMRFFSHRTIPGVAVADNSGKWPDQTDDGLLWLDPRRKIHIEQRDGLVVYAPVAKMRSETLRLVASTSCCGLSLDDLAWLLESGRWDAAQLVLGPSCRTVWQIVRAHDAGQGVGRYENVGNTLSSLREEFPTE